MDSSAHAWQIEVLTENLVGPELTGERRPALKDPMQVASIFLSQISEQARNHIRAHGVDVDFRPELMALATVGRGTSPPDPSNWDPFWLLAVSNIVSFCADDLLGAMELCSVDRLSDAERAAAVETLAATLGLDERVTQAIAPGELRRWCGELIDFGGSLLAAAFEGDYSLEHPKLHLLARGLETELEV